MQVIHKVLQSVKHHYAILATRKAPQYPTLRRGKGDPWAVGQLRVLLEHAGFPELGEGPFDEALERVVKAYQEDEQLIPDGIGGRQTWQRLLSEMGCDQPTRPAELAPKVERVNTLFAPEVWRECGYYSNQTKDSDTPYYGISRGRASQRAIAAAAGRYPRYGLTCGHFGDFFAKLWLGVAEPRTAATGMNLREFWVHRDRSGVAPSSTCGVALFDGPKTIEAKGWSPKVRGCMRSITRYGHLTAVYPCVVEYDSHIIVRLPISGHEGIIDPRTGLLARPGVYRVGADGGSKTPGRPWTFRRWRAADDAGVRHYWAITGEPGVETLRAYLRRAA